MENYLRIEKVTIQGKERELRIVKGGHLLYLHMISPEIKESAIEFMIWKIKRIKPFVQHMHIHYNRRVHTLEGWYF